MKNTLSFIPTGTPWNRNHLLGILNAAYTTDEYRFSHQVALAWLAYFPGDLPVKFFRAKALIADGSSDQAISILQNLINLDPEFEDAQAILFNVKTQIGAEEIDKDIGNLIALGNSSKQFVSKNINIFNWSKSLAMTRKSLVKGDIKNAEIHIQNVLGEASHTPLSGITHLKILSLQENTPKKSLQHLAEHYHQLWPDCLQFKLVLADTLMDGGELDRAVTLLHQVASQDITGQVAKRIWGSENPYHNLWPKHLEASIFVQLPSKVTAHLGWNLLPVFEGSASEDNEIHNQQNAQHHQSSVVDEKVEAPSNKSIKITSSTPEHHQKEQYSQGNQRPSGENSNSFFPKFPESLKSFGRKEFNGKQDQATPSYLEDRFPIYVVFTTQRGLNRKFGVKTSEIIDRALRKLITSIRTRLDWGAVLIYADEPGNMAQYGLKPVPSDDAWKLKLALTDLDDALGKRGAKVGAVLIIGGPDVVPFHYLPNPTDDTDSNVPSDNPYATRDENYFIPEWPIGRLPAGSGKDPGLLLSTLRSMEEQHKNVEKKPQNRLMALWQLILDIFQSKRVKSQNSFGYTAEAWRKASDHVYRPIGDPKTLVTSPPVEIHNKQPLPITKLGYFNLHGIQDSGDWFGQRDPRSGDSGPDFPIAIRPKDVQNSGRSPQVIFSEACFGANIINKSVEDALALKFLASGSQVVIGSTVISYGSVTTPLNAADLLGNSFWKHFKKGYPAGEALRRGKINLVKEMHKRQGYLDGEDQKTLTSFILYGDPLAQENELHFWKPRKIIKEVIQTPSEIKTICDRVAVPGTTEPIPKDVVANVKKIVDQYLPGMRDAKLWLSHEHAECGSEGHECPTSQLGAKTKFENDPDRRVVTLSKQVVRTKQVHESFARLTLDKQGNIVKLAVSR
jgi:hypothetical protein